MPSTQPRQVERTFLFTDVVGSTALWAADPDWMNVALHQHDDIVISAIERNNGTVFANPGDSFGAAFTHDRQAVEAAVEIAAAGAAVESHGLEVRIGIHRGAAFVRRSNLFGLDVSIAARLADVADGGQIVASSVVTESLDGLGWSVPYAVSLRNVPSPVRVQALRPFSPHLRAVV